MEDKHAQDRLAAMHRHPAGKAIVEKKTDWTGVCVGIGIVTVILSVCILAFGGKADAAERQPYGGCKEVYQVLDGTISVHSKGVRYCRKHGWIVNRKVVVDPFGHAVSNLPVCKQEDSTRCHWNALSAGNKRGHGYIALPGRTIYVDAINGEWATSKKQREGYWLAVPADV